MHSEASQVIWNPFLETLRIITTDILLMITEFSELKYDYEIKRKITAKLHKERIGG